MKPLHALLCLAVCTCCCLTSFSQRLYKGRCGNYQYSFTGKLINQINTTSPEGTAIRISTYYKVDVANDYIWIWTEETNATSQNTLRFITSWARLSDLDTTLLKNYPNESFLRIKLLSNQQFFFQTIYSKDASNPTYAVANTINVHFPTTLDNQGFRVVLENDIHEQLNMLAVTKQKRYQ